MVHSTQDLLFNCEKDDEVLRLIFSGKWRLKVLEELVRGPVRLSGLRRRVPNCSKKVMIDTLHGLERIKWIERQEFSTKLKRVEYRLAPPCADEIARVVTQLQRTRF